MRTSAYFSFDLVWIVESADASCFWQTTIRFFAATVKVVAFAVTAEIHRLIFCRLREFRQPKWLLESLDIITPSDFQGALALGITMNGCARAQPHNLNLAMYVPCLINSTGCQCVNSDPILLFEEWIWTSLSTNRSVDLWEDQLELPAIEPPVMSQIELLYYSYFQEQLSGSLQIHVTTVVQH